jgi:glutamate 5-kinase
VILTDVDGLYEEKPVVGRKKPKLIEVVQHITAEIEAAATGSDSIFGQGGMISKLEAAKSAALSGAATILCNGRSPDILQRIVAGEAVGTLFLPGERISSRKHWLAFTARTQGSLVVDAGAARALKEQGSSLLPAGILRVEGRFGIGDPVLCVTEDGHELARGLPAYSADEIRRIKQVPASQISTVLGYSNGDEIIHRDDLVALDN